MKSYDLNLFGLFAVGLLHTIYRYIDVRSIYIYTSDVYANLIIYIYTYTLELMLACSC